MRFIYILVLQMVSGVLSPLFQRKDADTQSRSLVGESVLGLRRFCSAGFQTCCVATSVRLLLKQRQLVRRPVSFILRTKCLKELFYGRFLEHADARDLENFVE